MNFDDEPEAAETYFSVADAKKLMSTPTATSGALNAYSLRMSHSRNRNTPPDTPAEPIDACSSYDFHIIYPRGGAWYAFFETPSIRPYPPQSFARGLEKLQLPHPVPPTDLAVKLTNDKMNDEQFDGADFLSDFPQTGYAVHRSSSLASPRKASSIQPTTTTFPSFTGQTWLLRAKPVRLFRSPSHHRLASTYQC